MRHIKTYITPAIKVRTIGMENDLLAASNPTTMSLKLEENDGASYNTGYITTADDIGAKSSNASDGWDDWEEE